MSAPKPPSSRHGARPPGNTVLRFTAWALAATLGFAGVFVYSYGATALGRITTVDISPLLTAQERPDRPQPPQDGSKGTAINILLVGSDVRSGKNGSIGGRVTEGMRSDTTIVMHISADRSRIEMMSIPRDTRVRIPDCTLFNGLVKRGWTGKFNIAFANGGVRGNPAEAAACTANAVEQLTDIYIHYYVVVDFAGFIDMIDALGGVPMTIDRDLRSSKAKLNLKKGEQVLTGRQALAYARMRTAEEGGVDGTDPQRIGRQQELLANTVKAAREKNLFFDVVALTDFIKAGADTMTMSPELTDIDYLVALAFSLRNVDEDKIVFATTPWRFAGQGDVEWTADAYTMFKRMKDDKPIKGQSVSDLSD